MNNSRFSSLIYRIIGNPDRWHEDYLDLMNQILDETVSFDEPYNFMELEVGDRIVSTLQKSSETINAFHTFLDKSRFKTILLNQQLKPIYHNHSAQELFKQLLNPVDHERIKPGLVSAIRQTSKQIKPGARNSPIALDYYDQNGDQIYLRRIQNRRMGTRNPSVFNVLMVLDRNNQHYQLNPDLIDEFSLTEKEQMVLRGLIHGQTIRQIAEQSFISENTVKTHLKAIFRKTDTNSQASVIRLILTHESQILDSYFESGIAKEKNIESHDNDRKLTQSDGYEIAYCEYGPKDGRPLIVFHSGYGCRLSIPPGYREVCERTNRRIIIPDRPGIGMSASIADHPRDWNTRLQDFIKQLGIDKYDVLASIVGAQQAVEFSATADQGLQKLILCAPVVTNLQSDIQYFTGILSPTSRLVKASSRFATEIYSLWLKSVNLNLNTNYKTMLESNIGSAEREEFYRNGTFQRLIDVFKEAARNSIDGIAKDLVYSLSPMNLDLKLISTPVEIWYGTEDQRLSREGLSAIFQDLPNCYINVREGYSEHIYYGLFEEIIA